jgi:hypothetical protein
VLFVTTILRDGWAWVPPSSIIRSHDHCGFILGIKINYLETMRFPTGQHKQPWASPGQGQCRNGSANHPVCGGNTKSYYSGIFVRAAPLGAIPKWYGGSAAVRLNTIVRCSLCEMVLHVATTHKMMADPHRL